MVKVLRRQAEVLSWIALSLSLYANPVECINSLAKDRNKVMKPRQNSQNALKMDSQYKNCIDDLIASDLNNNTKVDESEYVNFISIRSRGGIVGDYSSLPFSLISNFVYGSCFCSFVLNIPNCCVGPDAGIDIDSDAPFVGDNLITICRNTDQAIRSEIGTFSPTVSPTESPTTDPTNSPTKSFTGEPSEYPSSTPSSSATATPTSAPTTKPTTANPTSAPTTKPTTATPSSEPTLEPTTATPSSETTSQPTTFVPTTDTLPPTTSYRPSSAPRPTSKPTVVPTKSVAGEVLCINFQYEIENDDGLSAFDIFNGLNNTYRNDLTEATRETTIMILNETLPQGRERRGLRRHIVSNPRSISDHNNAHLGIVNLIASISFGDDTTHKTGRRAMDLPLNQNELTGNLRMNRDDRRLAFYTDSEPPAILNIFDNYICPDADEGIACAIVDTRVCVILEAGDDREEVEYTLLEGFKNAFRDGTFEKAVQDQQIF